MLELNQIYLGDCLELMKDVDDKSIDMILCDLPYGTTACKWDNVIPFEPLWIQYKRIIKDNGAIVLTASQPFTSKLVLSNLDWFKYEWIWQKTRPSGFLQSNKAPLKEHENILIFYKKQPTYNQKLSSCNIKTGRKNKGGSTWHKVNGSEYIQTKTGYNRTIKKFANPTGKFHSNQKPVALFEYFIKTYTNEGELVLDNCIGSGTTAIACMQTNRNFIGMELEPKYVDIANKRIKEFKQQLQLT